LPDRSNHVELLKPLHRPRACRASQWPTACPIQEPTEGVEDHPGAINALGGLTAQRIFATGHSQSAGRLATYVNSVHPLAHVFDAVIVHGGGGLIRIDLDIKMWKLLSETDVILSQAAVRQPDTNNVRTWEVAGDSHVDLLDSFQTVG
jgi:hypothetical protein